MFFRRRNRDLDEEIAAHLSLSARDRIDRGDSPEQARDAARREFGSEALVKEVTRAGWGWRRVERFGQDLRYALRQLRANPGFTATAVLTLALGIGANSAIFSVVSAVVLSPLPYPHAERLVWGNGRTPNGSSRAAVSAADFRDYRERNRGFDHLAALFVRGAEPRNWSRNGEARQLRGAMVTEGFFEALGYAPALGRSFTRADEQTDNVHVVILTWHAWQQIFAGDPAAIGQTVRVDGSLAEVAGVMPAALDFPRGVDFWHPAPLLARGGLQSRSAHLLFVVGRLRAGVGQAEAQRDLDGIALQLGAQYPNTDKGWGMRLQPMQDAIVGDTRALLWILLGAVALVLLIASGNIANLLLARYGARQREISIRTAIGAGRARILGQLLTENLLLAALAGGLALAFSWWGVGLLRSFGPPGLPRLEETRVDGRVILFTMLISLGAALFFGVAPAWLATGTRSLPGLREDSRAGAGRRRHRLGAVLVIGEMAISICLLIGAGLLLASLRQTLRASPGFQPERVLSTYLMLPKAAEPGRNLRLVERIVSAARALPGVEAAGAISEMPVHDEHNDALFQIVEHPPKNMQERDDADFRRVGPGYFETMSIPLLRGRRLDARDQETSARVVAIDEPFARQYFPGEDPIGKHLLLGDAAFEIAGVVGGVRSRALRVDPRPTFYLPMAQELPDSVHLVVRATADAGSLAGPLRLMLRAENPDIALAPFENLSQFLAESVSSDRFNALLLGVFAGLALALAVAGVYGVFSYVVTQQTHEIGVRMALGARPGQMLALILGRGAALAGAGAALGLTAAFFLTGVLSRQLYGVTPRDPATFAAAALALVAVALVACAIPARRAMRVDPLVALRCD